MASIIKETSAALRTVILGAYLIAVAFCVSGIWLVHLGASGSTDLSFFGQTFKSTNVGIAAIFLGAATVVLLLRRSLRSLDIAIRGEVPATKTASPLPKHWPEEKNLDTLKKKLRALSDTQWSIVMIVEDAEGISVHTLGDRTNLGPSMLYHRLNTLEAEDLIAFDAQRNVHLSSYVKSVSGTRRLKDIRG